MDDATAGLATDGDDRTSWCAGATAGPATVFEGEAYDDWWEAELAPGNDTVGAILMRSGIFENGRIHGHRIRDFAWVVRKRGEDIWRRVSGATLRANRAQLVFRFNPITNVEKVRLLIGRRDPEEARVAGANNPCLREARFYATPDATIPVAPWFLAVSTWEEGANTYLPLNHFDAPQFHVQSAVQQALFEILDRVPADATDEAWIGEMGKDWVLHEPRPSGILFSGNYKDYDQVRADVYAGFFRFARQNFTEIPMLGACGGHQLLAMAGANPTLEGFNDEFTRDRTDQVVVTCATDPRYACGGRPAARCCYEGGSPHPFRLVAPNTPATAMPNPYSSSRFDMLFNLLGGHGPKGFQAYLYHSDYVNPERVAPFFDVIASYPRDVANLDNEHPSAVQAIKLKGFPVYGTQFHWDENQAWSCRRGEGSRNMERVLKNFVLIALNRLVDPVSFSIRASDGQDRIGALTDLDRESMWCGKPGSVLEIEFARPVPLSRILTVEGRDPAQARQQFYRYEYAPWGASAPIWTAVDARRQTLHSLQKKNIFGCDSRAGSEDNQSTMTEIRAARLVKGLRIHVESLAQDACLRELMILKTEAQ